jgi:hypothetical protein
MKNLTDRLFMYMEKNEDFRSMCKNYKTIINDQKVQLSKNNDFKKIEPIINKLGEEAESLSKAAKECLELSEVSANLVKEFEKFLSNQKMHLPLFTIEADFKNSYFQLRELLYRALRFSGETMTSCMPSSEAEFEYTLSQLVKEGELVMVDGKYYRPEQIAVSKDG